MVKQSTRIQYIFSKHLPELPPRKYCICISRISLRRDIVCHSFSARWTTRWTTCSGCFAWWTRKLRRIFFRPSRGPQNSTAPHSSSSVGCSSPMARSQRCLRRLATPSRRPNRLAASAPSRCCAEHLTACSRTSWRRTQWTTDSWWTTRALSSARWFTSTRAVAPTRSSPSARTPSSEANTHTWRYSPTETTVQVL